MAIGRQYSMFHAVVRTAGCFGRGEAGKDRSGSPCVPGIATTKGRLAFSGPGRSLMFCVKFMEKRAKTPAVLVEACGQRPRWVAIRSQAQHDQWPAAFVGVKAGCDSVMALQSINVENGAQTGLYLTPTI